jgi:hypothetical protein
MHTVPLLFAAFSANRLKQLEIITYTKSGNDLNKHKNGGNKQQISRISEGYREQMN